MKKAIVTIGLFSFAMVLTSFTSKEQSVSSSKNASKTKIFKIENMKLDVVGDGGAVAGGKKSD